MRVLALDVSTHLGWALVDGVARLGPLPLAYGRQDLNTAVLRAQQPYPWSYLDLACATASSVELRVNELLDGLDEVVIEETNGAGRAGRYDLKLLEFMHHAILQRLRGVVPVTYVSTGDWRRTLGICLTKEDRAGNAALRKAAKLGAAALKEKKTDLGRRGKIDIKNVAVRWARETYGLDLLEGDDDIAEALAIGTARIRGCKLAIGTDRKPPKSKVA